MLELRPSCEHCNKALPPQSTDAMICTFECTFCSDCVDNILKNVCPNCAGGFTSRPIRPATNWHNNNFLGNHPAGTRIVHKPVDINAHQGLITKVKSLSPEQR
jgi:hypothetical protein